MVYIYACAFDIVSLAVKLLEEIYVGIHWYKLVVKYFFLLDWNEMCYKDITYSVFIFE